MVQYQAIVTVGCVRSSRNGEE